MKEYRLAEGEAKFADIIWDYEPVGSMPVSYTHLRAHETSV